MMENQSETKEFWAIVSLMGHTTLAGYLSEYTMGGCSFIKIEIPETKRQPKWTRLFKDNSVYSIDPVTEEVARYRAESLNISPMSIWDADAMLKKELDRKGQILIRREDLPEGFALPEATIQEKKEEDEFPF